MFKKKHKILLGVIALLLVILISIPFAAKYYINNNGKELIGRTINIESLTLNYFTGSVGLGELLVYEKNDKDTFLFASNIHVNPNVTRIIGGDPVIQNINVEGLRVNTILTDTIFNFYSLINHFKTTEEVEDDTTEVHYEIEKITLTNSYISYYDNNLKSYVALNNFNAYMPKGIVWDNPNLNVLNDFNFTTGGKVDAVFNYNLESGIYDLDVKSNKINLDILFPYFRDMMLVKDFKGEFYSDLFIRGNANEHSNIDVIGSVKTENMLLTDSLNRKVIAHNNFIINADSINPAKDIYNLSAIKMNHPYVLFELFPETDNFSKLFQLSDSIEAAVANDEYTSNVFIMIKDYVVETLQGIKASNFFIDTVAITNAEMIYADYSMLQPFKYTISESNLTAYNVKSSADSLHVDLTALLNNKGTLNATGILYPQKPDDVTLAINIDKLPMKDLSPYFHQYVAFPVTKGKLNFTSNISVKDSVLISSNNIVLKSFKLGEKQKHEDAYKVPLKMGVAMLKDRKGLIDLDVPVEGDLADPKYKVWKVIGKIFTEMLIKAATSPYKLVTGKSDEDITTKINVDNLISPLNEKHHAMLDKTAEVLIDKPELILLIEPYYYGEAETKKMAMLLAKASYSQIFNKGIFMPEEVLKINAVNEKDSLFDAYVNSMIKIGYLSQPTENKVIAMYKPEFLKEKVAEYIAHKKKEMHAYLLSKKVSANKIIGLISTNKLANDMTKTKNVQFHLLFDVEDKQE